MVAVVTLPVGLLIFCDIPDKELELLAPTVLCILHCQRYEQETRHSSIDLYSEIILEM